MPIYPLFSFPGFYSIEIITNAYKKISVRIFTAILRFIKANIRKPPLAQHKPLSKYISGESFAAINSHV